jgi:DNA-binding NarL/FixJ family response regulator
MAKRRIYKTTTIARAKAAVSKYRSAQKEASEAMRVRVLVVDDHAIMRKAICDLLSHDPTLDVICQTASGEEAVSKAGELQPDLVLLDIGLPGISGIEAARQIRKVSPKSHIIFLSQHDSLQMVNEALEFGGHGYVAKVDAGLELLSAIRAVREGTRFVSLRIRDQGWTAQAV